MTDAACPPTDLEDRFREAVEGLYVAFADHRQPRLLDPSPLARPKGMLSRLLGKPLRQLSAETLGPYSSGAVSTVGTDRDFRHFLPRILELSVIPSGEPGLDPALIGGKLQYCAWNQWPDGERKAVTDFFTAVWALTLTCNPDEAEPLQWLAAMARSGLDLTAALRLWETSSSQWAWLHLADFVRDQPKRFRETGEIRTAYWDDVALDTHDRVSRWLIEPALSNKLMAMSVEGHWADDWDRERLALAADLLDEVRANRAR